MSIYNRIWESDSNGCTVSTLNANGNPFNPSADVILNESVKADGDPSIDLATTPLFHYVKEDVLERDTYKKFITLLDNYVLNTKAPEEVTDIEKKEIDDFLMACFKSGPFNLAREYIDNELNYNLSDDEFFSEVKNMWFKLYTNYYNRNPTYFCSGFEHVFVGEGKFDRNRDSADVIGKISGYHSWIKFYLDEKYRRVNYLGYKYDLEGQGPDQPIVATLRMIWSIKNMHGVPVELLKEKGGFFVGRSPECEIALGTVAMFEARKGVVHKNDEIRLVLNKGCFHLILYRSTKESQKKGKYIRSFFPKYRGIVDRCIPEENNSNSPVSHTTDKPINDGKISIVSAMVNPKGTDKTGEWVELVSNVENEIDISNYELKDKMSRSMKLKGALIAGVRRRFKLNRTLSGGVQLGNNGGTISLYNEKHLIATVSYSSSSQGKPVIFKQ